MNQIIFNIHDVILLMTSILCLLLAFIYPTIQKKDCRLKGLLAGFLFCHALIAIHELSYYGEQFRYAVLELSPNLFFIGSMGYYLDAVLLYGFTVTLLCGHMFLSRKHLWHLMPLLGYIIYLTLTYYVLTPDEKNITIWNWRLTKSWHFVNVDIAIKLLRIGYASYCLHLIHLAQQDNKQKTKLAKEELTWLQLFITGFLIIFLIDGTLSIAKVIGLFQPVPIQFLSVLGVTSYYITFIFLMILMVYRISSLPEATQATAPLVDEEDGEDEPLGVERIKRYMQDHKPYLNADLTLLQLAEGLEIPAKALSMTLNHHFQMNFYEFINSYRIEEAKRIMLSSSELSITEIYYAVGFNSKSVFYTFFRKSEKMTPSAFRNKHAQSQA